jgi:hypothetical protein
MRDLDAVVVFFSESFQGAAGYGLQQPEFPSLEPWR